MLQNKTSNPMSLSAYKEGGLSFSANFGLFSLNYGRSAIINGPNGVVDITTP